MTILELSILKAALEKMLHIIRTENCSIDGLGNRECSECEERINCQAVERTLYLINNELHSRSYFDEGEVF